eukprot:7082452-Prymnesium_polylepis.1
MEDLARHLLERYGEETISRWFFEVWNEPTISFWSGEPKQATYFQLYESTAKAFHRVSPRFQLGGNALQWFPDFLSFCNATKTPVSFVSGHMYAGGDGQRVIFDADMLSARFARGRAQVQGLPLIISEWGGTYSHDTQLDDPSYAAFIVDAIRQNVHNADICEPAPHANEPAPV